MQFTDVVPQGLTHMHNMVGNVLKRAKVFLSAAEEVGEGIYIVYRS